MSIAVEQERAKVIIFLTQDSGRQNFAEKPIKKQSGKSEEDKKSGSPDLLRR